MHAKDHLFIVCISKLITQFQAGLIIRSNSLLAICLLISCSRYSEHYI